MQLEPLGKWNKEELRQLEVNDFVWIVDEKWEKSSLQDG